MRRDGTGRRTDEMCVFYFHRGDRFTRRTSSRSVTPDAGCATGARFAALRCVHFFEGIFLLFLLFWFSFRKKTKKSDLVRHRVTTMNSKRLTEKLARGRLCERLRTDARARRDVRRASWRRAKPKPGESCDHSTSAV